MRLLPTLLALLVTPALAVAQTSKPTQPAAPPAGKAVAAAIQKLRAAKLTKRLTQPRHYVLRERGGVMVLTLSGTEEGDLLKLKLAIEFIGAPMNLAMEYELGKDGALRRIETRQVSERGQGRKRTKVVQITIADGKMRGERTRDGAPEGAPFESPWSDNTLPAIWMWFVVPSLFDQGLPANLTPEIVMEERLRPNRKLKTVTFGRGATPTKTASGELVHTFKTTGVNLSSKREKAVVTVAASGPRQGLVLSLKNGQQGPGFVLISAKEYAQLQKDAPLIANETKAGRLLSRLRWAQRSYQQKHGGFAKSLDPLEADDKGLARELEQLQPLYLILLRASPDGSKWAALAVPAEPGKTGKRYFVINQDGKLHASETKLELDDSCAIPQGATPAD